ncbi:MAG: transketolase [candidate division KSB1 bacterium]|nr:transketolase [candidate division KSB1 bacterium]MDZ7358561.1 transketolase [candidate division KSB1 bacterium]
MSIDKLQVKQLEERANRLRIEIIKIMGRYGYGHIGGSLSIAEMIAVLYFHELKVDPKNPKWEDRDRFILSKGHACFTQYVALAELGFVSKDVLRHPYEVDSPMQAHPELGEFPGIEMTTGALGQGLSAGVGMAIGAKLRNRGFRIYVLLGDGEMNEGQVWEAIMLASKYKLDNLVALVDYNNFTLSGKTTEVMPLDPLMEKFQAFGWCAMEVDGHSVEHLVAALDSARQIKDKPTAIIAHTIKARGFVPLENKTESHAANIKQEQAMEALRALGCSESEIQQAFRE